MRAKTINFDELGYAKFISLYEQLKEEKKRIQLDINTMQTTCLNQKRNGNYDIAKELENEDIPQKQGELTKVEDQLAEFDEYFASLDTKTRMIIKTQMIVRDIDVELTDSEAQFLVDEYTSIVDENEKIYKDEAERYASYANHSLKIDEEINKYNDIQNDYEDAEKKYNDSLKVLNFAQNIISQDFSKQNK